MTFYKKINVMDCVARETGDYVRIALRLAMDKNYRACISRKIVAASTVIWEDMAVVQEFERAFCVMSAD